MPSHGSPDSRGFSIMELMIVLTIVLILAAIEIPNLLRARMAANQAAAVSNLRTLETAEITYAVTYNRGYSATLSQLGSNSQPSSFQAADLVDGMLAGGAKGGYSYLYVPGPVVDGRVETYTLKAVPAVPCATGVEYYSIDPSNQSAILTQSFNTVVEQDFIAQVLVGSMGRGQTLCTQ